MEAPSKKYRFHPLQEGVTVSVSKFRWTVTAATLTDEQAEYFLRNEAYEGLIVSIDEAEKIRQQLDSYEEVDLESMKKSELQVYLEETGVDFDRTMKKSELLELAKAQ